MKPPFLSAKARIIGSRGSWASGSRTPAGRRRGSTWRPKRGAAPYRAPWSRHSCRDDARNRADQQRDQKMAVDRADHPMAEPGEQCQRHGMGDVRADDAHDAELADRAASGTVTPSAPAPTEETDTSTPSTAPVATVSERGAARIELADAPGVERRRAARGRSAPARWRTARGPAPG